MLHPLLYRIGIDNKCFSTTIFIKWVAYSLWHACVVYFTVYYALSEYRTSAANGKEIGMWIAGVSCYGSCVYVVNALLAMKFHIHHTAGVILIALSVISYIIFFVIISERVKDEISHLYVPTVEMTLTWLTWLLSTAQVFIFEFAYSRFHA